jgi:hypothetical protein
MIRKALVIGALLGISIALATPSLLAGDSAAEINKDAQAALDGLYAKVDGAKALGAKAHAILVFPKITKAGLGIGGAQVLDVGVLLLEHRVYELLTANQVLVLLVKPLPEVLAGLLNQLFLAGAGALSFKRSLKTFLERLGRGGKELKVLIGGWLKLLLVDRRRLALNLLTKPIKLCKLTLMVLFTLMPCIGCRPRDFNILAIVSNGNQRLRLGLGVLVNLV